MSEIRTPVMQYKRDKHEICDADHEFVCECVDNRTAAAIVAALNKLARIEAATQADADDLEKMRDGSKLTRSGIVSLLAFQQEDIAELKAQVRSLEAQLSEARGDSQQSRRACATGMEGMNKLTAGERAQIRDSIDARALKSNPQTCRALLSLLNELEEAEGVIEKVREIAIGRISGPVHAREDHSPSCGWCKVIKLVGHGE